MIINNLELFFDREEGGKLFFKTSSGEELGIDKSLVDFSDNEQRLFLTLDSKKILGQAEDVLNEILETDNE